VSGGILLEIRGEKEEGRSEKRKEGRKA